MTACRLGTLLVLAGILGPATARGQEPLALDTAVRTVLAQNASLRAARAAASEAGERVTAARSGYFPRVSVAESWQRGDQPVYVFSSLLSARNFTAADFTLDALNHPDPVGFFQTRFGVEQLVFDFGRQGASAGAASLHRDIATLTVDQAAADLALAATRVFGEVLNAQSAARASRESLTAAREDLARAERRRDAGVATEADVLALKVHVADVEQQAIQAEGTAAIARAELNRLMGTPVDREFVATPPPDVELAESPSLTALLSEAEAGRPELRRAALQERLAESGRQEARAAYLPSVAARGVFDVAGTAFDDRATSWIVGAEVRWSFSTGGAEVAGARAASHALARARAEREDARAAIHLDVVRALRGLEAARARVVAGRAGVAEALESQRIIRDRFDAGIASVNDVLRASTAVLDAEASRTSALVDAVVHEAMLDRAIGRTRQ
ncbi:MAG TPA: TolC family protein [Vicinamibacterales bacterium]|nr:TolC family protein [Vicinamibacterales bacterium]